jgi:cytidine deaminase
MAKINQTFFNLINETFQQNISYHEGYFHIALIPKGKGFISSTNNYNRTYLNNRFVFSLHSEQAVLYKFSNIIKEKNKIKTLYVVRFNRNGILCCSKPCDGCVKAMKKNNVKYVVYSEDDGTFTKKRLNEL